MPQKNSLRSVARLLLAGVVIGLGAYWAGTSVVIADDLGPDHDEAVSEFRDLLRERGQA